MIQSGGLYEDSYDPMHWVYHDVLVEHNGGAHPLSPSAAIAGLDSAVSAAGVDSVGSAAGLNRAAVASAAVNYETLSGYLAGSMLLTYPESDFPPTCGHTMLQAGRDLYT